MIDFNPIAVMIAALLPAGIYAISISQMNRYFFIAWALSVPLMMFKPTLIVGLLILVALAIVSIAAKAMQIAHNED